MITMKSERNERQEESNIKARSGNMMRDEEVLVTGKTWKKYDSEEEVQRRFQEILNKIDNSLIKKGGILISEEEFNNLYTNSKINEVLSSVSFTPTIQIPTVPVDHFKRGPVHFPELNEIYNGHWSLNGKKQGYGVLRFENGCHYEGYFIDNVLSGEGLVIDQKGDYYKGMIINGKAEGLGEYIRSDGTKYVGEWKNDLMDGNGTETFENGTYTGEFADGEKNGKGALDLNDGSRYEGQFFKNNINGEGTFTWTDGRKYTGQWDNNKMHGKGVFVFSDGRRYEGDYVNDVKEGRGKYFWSEEKYYEGEFLNGKRHGDGILYNCGKIIKGKWENGKLIKDKELLRSLNTNNTNNTNTLNTIEAS